MISKQNNGEQRQRIGTVAFPRFRFCAAGHYKIFDINLRRHFYSPEVVHDSLCRSNILKTNDEELTVVSRMFGIQAQCRDLLEKYGLRTVILTCGAVGSHVFLRTACRTSPRRTSKWPTVSARGFVHGADQKGIGGGQLTAACSDETPGDFRLQ